MHWMRQFPVHGATVDLLGNRTLLKFIMIVIMLADAQGMV